METEQINTILFLHVSVIREKDKFPTSAYPKPTFKRDISEKRLSVKIY